MVIEIRDWNWKGWRLSAGHAALRRAATADARPAQGRMALLAERTAMRPCAEPHGLFAALRPRAGPAKGPCGSAQAARAVAALRGAANGVRLCRGPQVSSRLCGFRFLLEVPRDFFLEVPRDMTFTRKTGRARPVENEANVDVEVTRPKRHVKKPVAAADLPSTSQRPGKKRVQEGSAGSPPKRKKPAVQPPPKPGASKARPKVDVVSNVQWAYMKPEDICGVFAGISEFHQRRLGLRGVITRQYVPPNVPLCKEWLLSFDGGPQRDCSATVQGQRIVLTEEMFQDAFFIPEELNPPASSHPFPKHVMRSAVEDWFSRYDEKVKRYLAEDCVHEEWQPVFQCLQTFLLAKRRPRSISGPIIHFVKSALEPVIDEEDGEEDTSMIAHPKLLDLAGYQFKCVRDEMMQVKKHLEQSNNSRLRETFVGQVLTHLLIHLGIYKPSPEEDLNDDTQFILHEDVGSSKRRGPRAGLRPRAGPRIGLRSCAWAASLRGRAQGLAAPPRAAHGPHGPARGQVLEPEMQQRLLHALQTDNQMDVRLKERKAELVELERLVAEQRCLLEEIAHRRKEEERRLEELGANVYRPRLAWQSFLQACIREFHLMIWTSRPRTVIDCIFRFLFKSKKISFDFAHDENCTVWSREQCFDLGKTSVPLYYKDFDMLYEHNISARDVLIVEDEVAKIGCNNLMNALVPRRWDLSVETPSSSFLIDHLLPFFTTWRSSVNGIVQFVEETRPWATLPWVEEPVEALMKWWGLGVKKTKTWTDILFRSCTYEERKSLREMWTGITVRQKARVESVQRQKSPVESAAPVESSSPVLSAARVAIDEPSAPISSVVDEVSVPSTS
ncbi:hypothetical protein R1sor_010129 [Riccia sorocarpa]|uniref:FCP1 homology domain-containing protein n=1 Tax=Riccia sorocarpa TaxID=122646 RepID=A0ABD3HXD4_9MARC